LPVSLENVNRYPFFSGWRDSGVNERIVIVASTEPVTRVHLQRVLLTGLFVSAFLLLSAVLVAFRTVRQIDREMQTFADRQTSAKAAIDDIEREQAQLNSRWLQLARRRDTVRREEILDQLGQNRAQMNNALIAAYGQAELLRQTLYETGHGLLRWTVWLFAACVGLSLICASWAVRATASLFRRLEQQASELAQIQYQFLESQENVARRFSHELHDELGQTLTAVKANLSSLGYCAEQVRVEDCTRLVDQAIKNVREMSQLLRPTILDDFGLDAALRSLAQSFSQRTGVDVDYQSELNGRRLPDQAETNLYRIAQEALTNVARHAQATSVNLALREQNGEVKLTIRDNGRGFELTEARQARGLGLAGMETRARGCGGRLRLSTSTGKGLEIEVTCPIGK
jgi:signal transduction histidine kinase